MPAQLEVINTGNPIQRQETPLSPTEFKLNALLFFLAKSRFAWLNPAEPDKARPGGGQWRLSQHVFRPLLIGSLLGKSIASPVGQAIIISICLLPLLYCSVFQSPLFQKLLLFNIPIAPTGPEHSLWSGIFMESLFYLFFIATLVQIGAHRVPSPCPCSNGNVNMGK